MTFNYMYDPLIKVPLIIKWPGNERAGTVSPRMVNSIDLAPTLCRVAGCVPAPRMCGRALQDPGGGHELIFAEADGGRQVMVRSGERKLIISDSRIQQPNVPPLDLSHRNAVIHHYRDKMQALRDRR